MVVVEVVEVVAVAVVKVVEVPAEVMVEMEVVVVEKGGSVVVDAF